MRLLPERISVPTSKLVALLELARCGCRSEAERLLVSGVEQDLDEVSAQQARKMMEKSLSNSPQVTRHSTLSGVVEERTAVDCLEANHNATDFERLTGGATGTESTGAGDGDGGGKGAESNSSGA